MSIQSTTVPRWIPRVLYAAAIYNLAWAAFVILFPLAPFRWMGMAPPNYPAIVQCLGMVIGVYGVGYALAARDPVTRWPLVLVGLLGKVFGPIGFVYAAMNGEFPWQAGWTIVTNDIAWWLPFAAILIQAARLQEAQRTETEARTLVEALRTATTQSGESLLDLSRQQDLLIVCLRHSGCAFCREALHDLADQREAIRAAQVRPIVVHMGSAAQGVQLLQQHGLADIDQVSDADRRVYRGLELRFGTLSELAGPQVIWRALFEGSLFRYGFGSMIGNGLQLPGAFVVRDGRIIKAFRARSAAERPDYAQLACTPNDAV